LKIEKTRLPRGSRPVAEAFLTALDAIPLKNRPEVAKAAFNIVKEGLSQRKGVARQEVVTAKARKKPIAAKRVTAKPAAKPAKGTAPKAKRATAGKQQAAKPKLTVVVPTAAAA
jgi:hypothetical protein